MSRRTAIRIVVVIMGVLLLGSTAAIEYHHHSAYGHWIAYGWHVDLVSTKESSNIPGVEHVWHAVVTNMTVLPGSMEACMIPNDVQPHEIPFYPFRIERRGAASGAWRIVRPELTLECETSKTQRRIIWPFRSFTTETITPAATGGFQVRDWVRFVIYSSFDNHPGKRRVFVSPPFQYLPEWTGVLNTTLCGLLKTPDQFNGQLVQLQATYESSDERMVLIDHSCRAEIWLNATELHEALLLDNGFMRMLELANETNSDVAATMVGRFEHVSKARALLGHGFGHMGMWPSQLVLKSAYDLAAKPTGRSGHEQMQ